LRRWPLAHGKERWDRALRDRRPILVAVGDLDHLTAEVRHLIDGGTLARDRTRVGAGQGGHPTPPRTHTRRGGGARYDHQQVGSEGADLLLYRGVGTLTDAYHRNHRGHADDDAEHGEDR